MQEFHFGENHTTFNFELLSTQIVFNVPTVLYPSIVICM